MKWGYEMGEEREWGKKERREIENGKEIREKERDEVTEEGKKLFLTESLGPLYFGFAPALSLSLSHLYFSSFLSIAQCDTTLYSLRECVSSVKDLIKK